VTPRRPDSADEQVLRRTALRIGLQTAAAVAITVVGLAAVAVLVVLQDQHRADDDLMDTAMTRVDVSDPPAGTWVVVRRPGGQVATPGLPAGLPDEDQLRAVETSGVGVTSDFTVDQREFRVDTQPVDGAIIQVLLDLSPDHAERDRLLEAFLISGTAGLAVAAAVGVWLARRAVAPMAAALALQRRFVADAGHELRTPLTLLSTRAQLIRRSMRQGVDPDTLRSDVDGLVRDAHQLTDILDDLLLAADPREMSERELVDLPTVAGQAVDSARPLADERGIRLVCATAAETPPVVGARASLRRAMIALLDNAIRHAAGEVRLTVGMAGHDAVIDVADDGPGLDPDLVPTLFERFATAPADGQPGVHRRYGLGLALVSEIMARHGGSVGLVDDGGSGATFRLRLPADRVKPQEISQNGEAR
jgi:two-component system, OmpR family, sensor kinase